MSPYRLRTVDVLVERKIADGAIVNIELAAEDTVPAPFPGSRRPLAVLVTGVCYFSAFAGLALAVGALVGILSPA